MEEKVQPIDRREENICGKEGNDENCDGDISVTTFEKVAKAVVFTVVEKVAKVVDLAIAEKVAKAIIFTATEKVAKAVIFTAVEKVAKAIVFTTTEKVAKAIFGDNVVGCGGNVKTVKKGKELLKPGGKAVVSKSNPVESVYRAREDMLLDIKKGKKHSGGGENSSNWEQKEEDAIDNNGARKGEKTPVLLWVKREELTTYEGIDTQDQTTGATNASAMGSVEILNESLQVDGGAAKSVVATRTDEVRVEILRISHNWGKRIQEEYKSLEEDLLPPKPPYLNCKAIVHGVSSYDEDEP
ncbi:hypothetical protein V8G54_004185 [Vigna mungo]|uniref:Uncharacterized protein n=1 Tax=Vigna mungo TaxID=3915 RepID=A0AAQ3PD21_VIGMU